MVESFPTGIVLSVKMQAERQIEVLEKENSELKEELEQLKTKCEQLEVTTHPILIFISINK